jgi:hypothetical protein
MIFATRHEQDLAEIKSLTHQLDQNAKRFLGQLESINQSLDEQLGKAGTPDVNPSEPLLAFVHIPKTAGATVLSMFAAAYSRSAIRDSGNYFRNPEGAPSKIMRGAQTGGRVMGGHTPYGLLRENLPTDTRYMTFLREPVDRVLSHYWRHIRRPDPSRPRRSERVKQPLGRLMADSLQEAFTEMHLPQINNLATRLLCGHPAPTGDLPASALDNAKENLSEFEFVGIQERFEESLVLLQRMLGLSRVPYEDRHVSSDRPAVDEIPGADRALIEEHNQFDTELYEFGLRLFEDAVAVAGEGFAADVEALRAVTAEANRETRRNARAWLDRELPSGATRSAAELRLAAKADGLTIPALMQALSVSSVKRESRDGRKVFTRVSEPQ